MARINYIEISTDEVAELRALLEWANQMYGRIENAAFTKEEQEAICKHRERLDYAYFKILNYNRLKTR